MLQAQTLNRKAFDFFNSATIKVADYYNTLDFRILDQALSDLNKSIEYDPDFFQPLNYRGILYDIKGLPKKAIEEFNTIQSKNLSEELRLELSYNRAVAYYHLYSEKYILEAIRELRPLSVTTVANPKLKALSKAALAQSYGMMVLHAQKQSVAQGVESFVNLADSNAKKAISYIKENERTLGRSFRDKSIWIAYNALGISLMFRDDLKRDAPSKEQEDEFKKNLTLAISNFESGLEYSPNNWALTCNVASAHMRFGHLYQKLGEQEKAAVHFSKAVIALTVVINRLRPNYDFALYELGRIYRFQRNEEEALSHFEKALKSDGENRNISVESIAKNIQLVKEKDTKFFI